MLAVSAESLKYFMLLVSVKLIAVLAVTPTFGSVIVQLTVPVMYFTGLVIETALE